MIYFKKYGFHEITSFCPHERPHKIVKEGKFHNFTTGCSEDNWSVRCLNCKCTLNFYGSELKSVSLNINGTVYVYKDRISVPTNPDVYGWSRRYRDFNVKSESIDVETIYDRIAKYMVLI